MGLFKGMNANNVEKHEERVGGGFTPFASDVYDATVKLAWAGSAKSGAMFVDFTFDVGGRDYNERIYYTNKNGDNFYTKDGKKFGLPGFHQIDALCLITTGEALENQDTEEKIIKVYNFEKKAEENISVPVITEMLGKPVSLAIIQSIESINEKNDAGEYVPTDKTRPTNSIDMLFDTESKLTVSEARRGEEEPELYNKWLEKNRGEIRDKTKATGKKSGAGERPQAGSSNGSTARKSLFGAK